MTIQLDFVLPKPSEFNRLRALMGWCCMTESQTQKALQQSLFAVCAREHDELLGFARVIGDGCMYFYVQDVMVHPEFQGQGVGHKMMQEIEAWLNSQVSYGSTIGLLAAKDKEGFYHRYGYLSRPNGNTGAGMYRFVDLIENSLRIINY